MGTSKVRLIRFWNLGDRCVKRDVVFGADGLFHHSRARAVIGLPRGPRHVKRTRIFDVDPNLQCRPAFSNLEVNGCMSSLLGNLAQGPRWASHLANSGRPMIVLVASRGPCVAAGTGRATPARARQLRAVRLCC
jgi:hypothetical protein